MLLTFLVQRPFDGVLVPQAEKPDFRLINKFLGPCIPLRTHGTSEVFADATNISLQTAYGLMGAKWKYLGEARLKYWGSILKENIVVTLDEPISCRHFYSNNRMPAKKKPHPRSKTAQEQKTRLQKRAYKAYTQVTKTDEGNIGNT